MVGQLVRMSPDFNGIGGSDALMQFAFWAVLCALASPAALVATLYAVRQSHDASFRSRVAAEITMSNNRAFMSAAMMLSAGWVCGM
jgi:hypothetical protein